MLREMKVDPKEVNSDMGEFNNITLQMDIIWKHTVELDKNAKDQERELTKITENLHKNV